MDAEKVKRLVEALRARKANVRFREVESLLRAAGRVKRPGARHVQFKKPGRPPISVPNHPGALKPTLVDRILDEVELDIAKEEEAADGNE